MYSCIYFQIRGLREVGVAIISTDDRFRERGEYRQHACTCRLDRSSLNATHEWSNCEEINISHTQSHTWFLLVLRPLNIVHHRRYYPTLGQAQIRLSLHRRYYMMYQLSSAAQYVCKSSDSSMLWRAAARWEAHHRNQSLFQFSNVATIEILTTINIV